MAGYIDGFVFPIPIENLGEYQRLARSVAEIWKEHGATEYQEYVSDDPELSGTRSFTELMGGQTDEIIVFGWVAFDSREARDLANQKVAADPRMAKLVESSNTGFDATRMAYGGFRPLVDGVEVQDE